MKYISRSVCYLVEISPAKSSLKTRPHHVCARETPLCAWIHTSHVLFVTEYSAEQGSSGFSKEHLLGMDAVIMLLVHKQGTRSLEGYIVEYLALANGSELPDCMLIDFFCDGLNRSLKSKVIHKGPCLSFVLCSEDCWFSVHCGCRGGMRHHTHLCDSSRVHKMVATTTSCHVISASHEPSQFTVDLHKPSQVTSLHKCFKRKGQIKNSIHFDPVYFKK